LTRLIKTVTSTRGTITAATGLTWIDLKDPTATVSQFEGVRCGDEAQGHGLLIGGTHLHGQEKGEKNVTTE
jgi:hypothetical protein